MPYSDSVLFISYILYFIGKNFLPFHANMCYNNYMDNVFINHLKDLSRRADKTNRFTFTGFLGLDEQNDLKNNERELCKYTLFGGIDGCERVVARFGNVADFGYEESFPIVCLKAEPLLEKFADVLTHRDYLGAMMNLGIERKNIGDIVVRDPSAYIFLLDTMCGYVMQNLTKVKHTAIKCTAVKDIPDGELFKLETHSISVASMRLDCIIAAVFDLSRNQCDQLFAAQKIFVNGRLCENTSHVPKPDDVISVRGFGRFILGEKGGVSRKGRQYTEIKKFI